MARLRGADLVERIETLVQHARREIAMGGGASVQNAAGKAWAAANLAMSLVIEARTGRYVSGTKTRRGRLEEIAKLSPKLKDFHLAVEKAFSDLHLLCSDDGDCDARLVSRRVRDIVQEVLPVARAHAGE